MSAWSSFLTSQSSWGNSSNSSSSSNHKSDHGSVGRGDDFLGSRRELDPGPVGVGDVGDGHHVADGDLGLLTTVHKLSGVHAFCSNKKFLLDLVSVRITEMDDSKGSTTTWVMDNVSDHTLDVSVSLSIVDSSEGGLALPMLGVSSEHGPSALSLGSDHTTHLSCRSESSNIC